MNRNALLTLSAMFFAISLCTVTSLADDKNNLNLLQTFATEFVLITPAEGKFPSTFEMGNDQGAKNERPQHRVTMTQKFSIAKFEVPQNLYEGVMGSNPSRWKGPRNSVEMMSWQDANDFCDKVTQMLQSQRLIAEDEVIRLPSEVEWEYCCRAGTRTVYSFGDSAQQKGDLSPIATNLNQFAWHTGNAKGNDPPVGALKPNPWGLYDMHGYLWEFTSDDWKLDDISDLADDKSHNPNQKNSPIVIRGGSWKDRFDELTSSTRRAFPRSDKDDAVGFRCVKSKRVD